MKTDFVALCASQKAEKRALVRIGGPQKVGAGPSLAARGLLTIVSLKYWHSLLIPPSVFRQEGIASSGLYKNSRFKMDESQFGKYQIETIIVVYMSARRKLINRE